MRLHDNSYVSLQLGYCPKDRGLVGFENVDLEYRLVDTVFPSLSSDAIRVYIALRYLQNLEDAAPTPILPLIRPRFCPGLSEDQFNEAIKELTSICVNDKPLVQFEEADRDLLDRQEQIRIEIRRPRDE